MTLLRAMPVRFRILALLVLLSFINYLLRNNISVAIPSIREEFGFTSAEIGWILGSFNLTYTLFQIPGGIFGEAFGYRRAMASIAITAATTSGPCGFETRVLMAA